MSSSSAGERPLPAFRWEKLGRVFCPQEHGGPAWMSEFAQAPATLLFDDFVRVYFDYDQSFVRSDASSELSKNVGCWQARTTPISIEGHCDERGTVEYNIALGNRRAQSAKSYLQNQGISGSRITTVSYGEERPVARGGGESAYSQNRRADIYSKE